jgi:hypothetical protein
MFFVPRSEQSRRFHTLMQSQTLPTCVHEPRWLRIRLVSQVKSSQGLAPPARSLTIDWHWCTSHMPGQAQRWMLTVGAAGGCMPPAPPPSFASPCLEYPHCLSCRRSALSLLILPSPSMLHRNALALLPAQTHLLPHIPLLPGNTLLLAPAGLLRRQKAHR